MAVQKKITFMGNWWKYQNNDKKISGLLEIINNKEIILITNNLFPSQGGAHSIPERIEVIHGETSNKEPVTLFWGESWGASYNCRMALVGEHYKDFDDVKFKKIKINYSLLNEWAYSDWIESYIVENNKTVINYFKKDNISVKIPNFNLIIEFHFNLKTTGKNQLNKKRITFITITSTEPQNLNEWWNIIVILRNFIILGLNTPVYPSEFTGITDKYKQIGIYRIAYKYNDSDIGGFNHRGELFTLKNIENNFSIYLNSWFNKSVKLNKIITNYYSTLNNPDIYYEDKLLHFISLLEGYHRYNKKNEINGIDGQEDYKDKINKILTNTEKCLEKEQIKFLIDNINPFGYEKRLGQRLKELLNENKVLIPLNNKDKYRFIKKVKDTRDFWTHKLVEKDKLLQGAELSKAITALEMLLICCLLREIEFKDDLLIKLFKGNNKFTYFYDNTLSLFRFKS